MKRKKWFLSLTMAVILLFAFIVPVAAMAGPVSVEAVDDPPVSPFAAMTIIAALAFIVETLVEALIGRPLEQFPKLKPYKWMIIYIAVGVGILGAFIYQFDVLYLLGVYLGYPIKITSFGMAITGTSIGMGAAYINQIVSKYFPTKA